VFILFRGSGDVPVTKGKLYCAFSWRDIKEPVDYIFKTYAAPRNRRIYLYACSLGAAISSNYLCNDPEAPISGAVFYGTPINLTKSAAFLMTTMFGFYDVVFGYDIKKKFG